MNERIIRLKTILERIQQLTPANRTPPRLIAISKTKPIEDIIDLYQAGQRYFGENYAEELEKKSTHPLIIHQCPDIRWHFVGHLQRKKVPRMIGRVKNLDCIQTIDSIDLAKRLNETVRQNLNVLIQINTSQEKQKYGIEPTKFLTLYDYIRNHCSLLNCQGLMTIGSIENVQKDDDHDFRVLTQCRDELAQTHNLNIEQIQLSMGMSHDFERAILAGSTIVRVGSSIFGIRNKK